MIKRKILKVKTIGSRKVGNLQPDFEPEHGMNMLVLEYNETEGWAIIELWGSDHVSVEKTVTTEDLERMSKHASVIASIASHSRSPSIIGTFAVAKKKVANINLSKKTCQINGKTVPFKRIVKTHRTDDILLDEG